MGYIARCHRLRLFLLLVMLLPVGRASAEELQYPAYCRTTTGLNVRSGPGTQYEILGQLAKGDTIIVNRTEKDSKGKLWGSVYYYEPSYVSMHYVEYLSPYIPPAPEKTS